jgi:hypothetical protein
MIRAAYTNIMPTIYTTSSTTSVVCIGGCCVALEQYVKQSSSVFDSFTRLRYGAALDVCICTDDVSTNKVVVYL